MISTVHGSQSKQPPPTTTVIIATYNWPEALELTIAGLLVQTDPDFDVIIADDGSTSETAKMIETFQANHDLRIRHIWHEDKGFRKAKILNQAIRIASSQLIVFVDQDAIAERNLIQLHREAYRPNQLAPGGYFKMSREQSATMNVDKVRAGEHEKFITEKHYRWLRKRHRNNLFYNFIGKKNRPKLMGLNFSVARDLLEKINGYDESYEGWGSEDSDLRTRMRLAGGKSHCLWHKALIIHQWHTWNPSKFDHSKNKARYKQLKKGKLPWRCEHGLKQGSSSVL